MDGYQSLEIFTPWTTFNVSRRYSINVCSEYSRESARVSRRVETNDDERQGHMLESKRDHRGSMMIKMEMRMRRMESQKMRMKV